MRGTRADVVPCSGSGDDGDNVLISHVTIDLVIEYKGSPTDAPDETRHCDLA